MMNSNCYRIIFSKTRGALMAVAESVSAAGKVAGGSRTSRKAGRKSGSYEATVRQISFSLFAAWGLAVCVSPAHAQIVAYRNAPAGQQATILNAGNGVPLVNIQTPSAAGVSRNAYSQFDVQQAGAILNNSRSNVLTQLGGWVQGNPWLATGTASVILNEVVSVNASQLLGTIEVAGARAQVVIANPAGITCDGCGFINASRATLTTGTPIVNGGALDGYRVEGGTIRVQGAGFDARQTDYTDLIARSVEINAGLWAQTLTVTAGANQVSVDQSGVTPVTGSGAAPAFAIDVAQLGGMYAGKITLIGTEAGIGVRNAGTIGASAGEVIVSADGRLHNSGRIDSSGAMRLGTRSGIDNSGTIYAQSDLALSTRGDLNNSGLLLAQGNTALVASGGGSRITSSAGAVIGAGINADATLGSTGRLDLAATTQIAMHGQSLAAGDQFYSAAALDLADAQVSGNNVNLTATGGDLDVRRATIAASGTLSAHTSQTLWHDDASSSAQQLDLAAHDISNVRGELVQTGRPPRHHRRQRNLERAHVADAVARRRE